MLAAGHWMLDLKGNPFGRVLHGFDILRIGMI
jgi:hypothetical protein